MAIVAFTVSVLAALVLFAATPVVGRFSLLSRAVLLAGATGLLFALIRAGSTSLVLGDGTVLLVAVFAGSILAYAIIGRAGLVSFCMAAAGVDIVSFLGGSTAALNRSFASGGSALLQHLSVSVMIHGRPQPIVGIGDLVILTAIYAALRRLGARPVSSFLAPTLGLCAALVVGLIIGGVFAIPFIAATTIAYVLWNRVGRFSE